MKRAAEIALPKADLPAVEHPFDATVRIARDIADRGKGGALDSAAATYVSDLKHRDADAVGVGHEQAPAGLPS
ncbi:MAG: hypothetical protein HYZ53_13360 [Planctomycetes bacterium]|nr:hypothetical protein [Planctomycetota bacterium]